MSQTYLTTEELSGRIKYDAKTIRRKLKDTVLIEGIHYFRPFGGERSFIFGSKLKKTCSRLLPFKLL